MFGRERVELKTPEQVRVMRRAGLVVASALDAVRDAAVPGVTTAELDRIAADTITAAGATSNFLGYPGGSGNDFPATTCISVNDEVVHGIPGSRALAEGDVVSVDCGAVVDGWHGDAAITILVGGPQAADEGDVELDRVTRESLWVGIAAVANGSHIGDVGNAIDDFVNGRFGILEDYTGHGIGSAMHQPPDVINYRSASRGPKLKRGMCLAVEPMLVRGTIETVEQNDGWTVVTADGSTAAHWEHTVAIVPGGISVLTAHDSGAADLSPFGITVVSLD